MKQGLGIAESVVDVPENPAPELQLLITHQPWSRVFLQNLADFLWPRRPAPLTLVSWPAPFWPDVFVASRQPWGGAAVSVAAHLLVFGLVLFGARYLPKASLPLRAQAFDAHDVIYYSPAEYLPPLQSGDSHPAPSAKADPAYAAQPIISVPPEADNRSQTIVTPPVTPPNVKLDHDVPLPNIVAWSKQQPAVPLGATSRLDSERHNPSLTADVVAPSPQVAAALPRQAPTLSPSVVAPAPEMDIASDKKSPLALPSSVVAPAPQVDITAIRQTGDLNIGHAQVVAPAPQLPVAEQRTLAAGPRPTLGGASSAVPPPPSVQGTGSSGPRGAGQLIALNVHPLAPAGPVEVPAGNRRGTFAATPQGKPGAAGTPGSSNGTTPNAKGSGQGESGAAGTGKTASDVPPGLTVGAPPKEASPISGTGSGLGSGSESGNVVNPNLLAKLTRPRISAPPRELPDVSGRNANQIAEQVFGARKYYSMNLNMPNLNSAGGSWVIRFAELKDDGDPGEIAAPVATREVDPAYPLELMQRNVKGTVTLYAVIQADGSVADVRVLHGVDDQLDKYAREALAKWRFQPGTKNGNPVALEAVVMIPFKPILRKSAF